MAELSNSDGKLLCSLFDAIENNVTANGMVMFSAEAILEEHDHIIMHMSSAVVVTTLIYLIEQCYAGLNEACAAFATLVLSAYFSSRN